MLTVKNLKKSFNGRQILDGVNFTVKDGEILCIVGPSGAGKTTLLRCITGLDQADSGSLELDGKPFDPQDTNQSVFGVVFQDFNLFPNLSVRENITLAPRLANKVPTDEANKQADKLMDELGLSELADQYPWQLSGGQKQRLALARSLAMKPRILCYDEPTSALDPHLRDEVANLILNLKKEGMTQLVITHDMDFAKKIADQLLTVKALDAKKQEA